MTIDKHTLALVSIAGSSLDMLGALYLAYDLLGGEHGPLRTLTRGVTYGLLFGIGYGLGFGPVFGLTGAVAHGITLAWEYSRASRGKLKPGFWYDTAMCAIRGAGFGLGFAYLYGITFGLIFGAVSMVSQLIAYQAGIRPTMDYRPAARPRLTKHQFLAALNRTVGYAAAGYFSALAAHQRENALNVGLKAGLVIGVVTAISSACTSLIEWIADRVPEKRMGVFGIILIVVGFSLQSIQYWVALLDVEILAPVAFEHPPNHQVQPAIIHPLGFPNYTFSGESQSLGDRATARILGSTSNLHAMQAQFVKKVVQHHGAASRDQALALQRRVHPITNATTPVGPFDCVAAHRPPKLSIHPNSSLRALVGLEL